MNNQVRILELSACGNKGSAAKLKYQDKKNLRSLSAISIMSIRKGEFDLIAIRDISYPALSLLGTMLKAMGYRMIIDPSWEFVEEKWRYTCISALFVGKNISSSFNQITDKFEVDTPLRYVSCYFRLNGYRIYYRTSHTPCVSVDEMTPQSQIDRQVARKENMLGAEIDYQKEHINDLAISSGDFNGGRDEDCHCKEVYSKFSFTDLITEPTYGQCQLDHVFVSDGFKDVEISVKAEVLNDFYMELTDHRIIVITLEVS